jgi:hypothetical protein
MKKRIWILLAVKLRFLLLAVTMGFAAVLIWMVLIEVSSALALEGAGTDPVRLAQPAQQQPPEEDIIVTVVFTDPASTQITDLSGNPLGEGTHEGELRCNLINCSKKTHLSFTSLTTGAAEYEYKFTTRQALDPEAGRVVVAGSGTISNGDRKERFQFTAIFQDNRDGTVLVRYEASRPDASFIVPESPGNLLFRRR